MPARPRPPRLKPRVAGQVARPPLSARQEGGPEAHDGGRAPGTLHPAIVRGIEKKRIVDDAKDRENFVMSMGKIPACAPLLTLPHAITGRRGIVE